MKKIMLAASCIAFMVACGGNTSEYEKHYEGNGAETEAPTAEGTAAEEEEIVAEEVPTKVEVASAATQTPVLAEASTDNAQAENYEKGAKLVAQSDCFGCHKEDTKLVGPAYIEVAKKYEFNDKNVSYLANKIIEGGSGVWGQIPMSPHPALSKADAEEMAKYVLSLNKK